MICHPRELVFTALESSYFVLQQMYYSPSTHFSRKTVPDKTQNLEKFLSRIGFSLQIGYGIVRKMIIWSDLENEFVKEKINLLVRASVVVYECIQQKKRPPL